MIINRVNVIGAGAWGTALASVIAKVDDKAQIWAFEPEVSKSINESHLNELFLPGIKLPKNLTATSDMKEAVKADVLLVVSPTQLVRRVCKQMQEAGLKKTTPLIICSKGIENDTSLLLSEVIKEVLPDQQYIAVLSGPNFAKEVAKGQLAASTLACTDETLGKLLVSRLGSAEFRTYLSTDIMGAQICGAVKNVLAIACGIARGKGFGENVIATLITRGLVEISKLIEAKGGNPQTVMGMCGVGDVLLTCTSLTSRNTSFGYAIGKGEEVEQVLAEKRGTIEGYYTTKSVYFLAKKLHVEMPISNAVYQILYEKLDTDEMIHHLLAKPLSMDI